MSGDDRRKHRAAHAAADQQDLVALGDVAVAERQQRVEALHALDLGESCGAGADDGVAYVDRFLLFVEVADAERSSEHMRAVGHADVHELTALDQGQVVEFQSHLHHSVGDALVCEHDRGAVLHLMHLPMSSRIAIAASLAASSNVLPAYCGLRYAVKMPRDELTMPPMPSRKQTARSSAFPPCAP